jgi:hypothetical protein
MILEIKIVDICLFLFSLGSTQDSCRKLGTCERIRDFTKGSIRTGWRETEGIHASESNDSKTNKKTEE